MKLKQNDIYEALEHARLIIERSRIKDDIKLPVIIKDHVGDLVEDYLHYLVHIF